MAQQNTTCYAHWNDVLCSYYLFSDYLLVIEMFRMLILNFSLNFFLLPCISGMWMDMPSVTLSPVPATCCAWTRASRCTGRWGNSWCYYYRVQIHTRTIIRGYRYI